MKRIKIGQIGIGHNHGAEKMLAVRKFPHLFEIIGYAEEKEEWLQLRGNNPAYQGLKQYTQDELIAKCDAILVETDVWDLTKTAKKCVQAGKHIHMDKPASGSLEEYKEVLDTAKEKKLVVQLGYMYRYNPAIKKCIECVQKGELGEIYSINAEMSTCHSPSYRQWLTNFKGGIFYILGSHMIDLIVYLLGEPKRVVSCFKQTGKDGVEAEDNTFALLEYDKALARVFVSSAEVNGYGRRQFVVSGRNATIDIKPIERPCVLQYSDLEIATATYEDKKITQTLQEDSLAVRYDEMMEDFYACIVGEKENPFSYAHEYTVQKVLLQIVNGGTEEKEKEI